MPDLKTPDGKPVPVAPADEDAVNRAFVAAMNDDGPDDKAPPKRQSRTESTRGGAKPRTARARTTKAEKARTAASGRPALSDDQRTQGVAGLVQVAAAIPLMFGKATGSAAFTADAVTIASNADQITSAVVETARQDARFAAALDKVCSVGPYAALIGVAVSVGSQVVRNHKPSLALPGTVDPKQLLDAQAQAEAEAADVPAAA